MSDRLDSFDYRILEILQENNLATHREIAGAINLSTPAVARRIGAITVLQYQNGSGRDLSVVR